MKYKISGTSKIPKQKAATRGYKPFETDSADEFIEYLNTHAVLPSELKNG